MGEDLLGIDSAVGAADDTDPAAAPLVQRFRRRQQAVQTARRRNPGVGEQILPVPQDLGPAMEGDGGLGSRGCRQGEDSALEKIADFGNQRGSQVVIERVRRVERQQQIAAGVHQVRRPAVAPGAGDDGDDAFLGDRLD